MEQTILIIDFGSQYTQLIARRIRELNVYCEIHPCHHLPLMNPGVRGVILSGSPFSVNDAHSPAPDLSDFISKVPVLAICYGAQYLAKVKGGKVLPSDTREYGRANLSFIDQQNPLMKGMTPGCQVWMSHGDTILEIPQSFNTIASTADVAIAGYQDAESQVFGIQFHPEVYHTPEGATLLRNFAFSICGCQPTWTPASFIERTVEEIQHTVGSEQVVLGLSGGVDSSVAAVLMHKAIGKQLHCIFVDNGLLRKNEFESVLHTYQDMGLNIKGVDAKDRFLDALQGVSEPEDKRKIIGKIFIHIFEEAAHSIPNAKWLAQGTIYPDVIESVSVKGPSATIKSHHNVGGLPDFMKLKVVEPLKSLFKDEVRNVGKELGINPNLINRHPFPGPGLGVRILGDITREKVRIAQETDFIFIEALKKHSWYNKVWQAGVILLPVKSVGVMGDERTYENVVALRAVGSTDGMTADWIHLPYDFLALVSNEIINKVKGVNRVVYDISSKPPATIEWE
ncbi:MAG: glutamine-hydrolyzing GMP synthase [Bacteroidales bacterium]|nr:glutamine-hydrolyzing GMP synthase [Bacteroidales bacterium]MDZ4204020.1 glutamine-hydrolyzing GMP synthase [Bacteroidales bacterium]